MSTPPTRRIMGSLNSPPPSTGNMARYGSPPSIRRRSPQGRTSISPVRSLSYNANSNSNSNSNSNTPVRPTPQNNKPHKLNKNVKAFINSNVMNANKKNIPASKRVYVKTNVGSNNKINHVYNKRVLMGVLRQAKKTGTVAKTPLKRTPFKKRNIKAYPPVNANNTNSNSNSNTK